VPSMGRVAQSSFAGSLEAGFRLPDVYRDRSR
jgi:hypothetical protein